MAYCQVGSQFSGLNGSRSKAEGYERTFSHDLRVADEPGDNVRFRDILRVISRKVESTAVDAGCAKEGLLNRTGAMGMRKKVQPWPSDTHEADVEAHHVSPAWRR